MNRRALVKAITSGAVLISVGGVSIVACDDNRYQPVFLKVDSYQFLSNLSKFILPDCEASPGANKAGVASFLDRYIPICKSPDFQVEFKFSIEKLSHLSQSKYGKSFQRLSVENKAEQINTFEKLDGQGYKELKSLILFAYFTSMEGMTKALRYVAIPEKYDGDISYEKDDKSWAI